MPLIANRADRTGDNRAQRGGGPPKAEWLSKHPMISSVRSRRFMQQQRMEHCRAPYGDHRD
jgi:hypothetical protein